jgi:hypothetical protein
VNRHHENARERSTGARAEALAPYRVLASQVIALAMRDLLTRGHSSAERDSARAFLSGSQMLNHWCELADIDAAAVRARVQWFVENGRFSSPSKREH